MFSPIAPVAYEVILEPGTGHFHELESPRVHTHSFIYLTGPPGGLSGYPRAWYRSVS